MIFVSKSVNFHTVTLWLHQRLETLGSRYLQMLFLFFWVLSSNSLPVKVHRRQLKYLLFRFDLDKMIFRPRETAKKLSFSIAVPLRPLTPPPSRAKWQFKKFFKSFYLFTFSIPSQLDIPSHKLGNLPRPQGILQDTPTDLNWVFTPSSTSSEASLPSHSEPEGGYRVP